MAAANINNSAFPNSSRVVLNTTPPLYRVSSIAMDIDIDSLLQQITIKQQTFKEEYQDYLFYNVMIRNYNTYAATIKVNAVNDNSPIFNLEFYYDNPIDEIITGKIENFKDINQVQISVGHRDYGRQIENYLQTEYLNQIFKKDLPRAKFYIKEIDRLIDFSKIEGINIFNQDLFGIINVVNKLLQLFFDIDEFPDLSEEDFNIGELTIIEKKELNQKLLFSTEISAMITGKLQKIINTMHILHQSYLLNKLKKFIDTKIIQTPSDSGRIVVIDKEQKLINHIFYINDNFETNDGYYKLPRGIMIHTVYINSHDNDGKFTYIPIYKSKPLEPINDCIRIPKINNNNEISRYFFRNYLVYYSDLLKNIINLSNNINILANLNDKIIEQYIKINLLRKITGVNTERLFEFCSNNAFFNVDESSINIPLNNLEELISNIIFYLERYLKEDKDIIRKIPISIDIFITKNKFISLLTNQPEGERLPTQIIGILESDIEFLDIIQITNYGIQIYKRINYRSSLPNELDAKMFAGLKKFAGANIIFNFIISSESLAKPESKMEDTLDYDEFTLLSDSKKLISEFMSKNSSIHIPFCSFHARDTLIASLFSNCLYGNNKILWTEIPSKLFEDSNLDRQLFYSLLNNIIIKCLLLSKDKKKELESIREYLKHIHKKQCSKINFDILILNKPYDSQICTYIQDVLLSNIDIDNELLQKEYMDNEYNIFDLCNIKLFSQMYDSRNLERTRDAQAGGNKIKRNKHKTKTQKITSKSKRRIKHQKTNKKH